MKPSRASFCVSRSRRTPFTRSSGTSAPFDMYSCALSPSGVFFSWASRRRSPVETWTALASARTRFACVPLPPPGAPKNARRILASPAADAARLHEAFVVAHEEVRLDLLDHVERDADDDQDARAAEEARDVLLDLERRGHDHREHGEGREEDRAHERDPVHD